MRALTWRGCWWFFFTGKNPLEGLLAEPISGSKVTGKEDISVHILPGPARADCALWGSTGVDDLGLVEVGVGWDWGADARAHVGEVDACG